MVHIKSVELTNFKSFGGTSKVPLLPGFTVVSGPNGSGKSNIIDALLFALGLSSSKGMRAERLPDLVNHKELSRGRYPVEALVTVTFDLSDAENPAVEAAREVSPPGEEVDPPNVTSNGKTAEAAATNGASEGTAEESSIQSWPQEWSVTRKLRVTKSGTYTSTYYTNGVPCTLGELHEQLHQLRIYTEGYNVVLQGDVTGIIAMNGRQRRQIIDELAGVGEFDRKIATAKEKLDEVKERLERSRILEQELQTQRDRLEKDRAKAEQYQNLKTQLEQKQQWHAILSWRLLVQQQQKLQTSIEQSDRTLADLNHQLTELESQIHDNSKLLEEKSQQVKALGEDELLHRQSTLANQQAQLRQNQTRTEELSQQQVTLAEQQETLKNQIEEHQQQLQQIQQNQQQEESEELASLRHAIDIAKQELAQHRQSEAELRESATSWVNQQNHLHHEIETLTNTLNPLRTEQARCSERQEQLQRQIHQLSPRLQELDTEMAERQQQLASSQQEKETATTKVQKLAEAVSAAESEVHLQQETQNRLLREQRQLQRELDKLEAQAQVQQESQGTKATQIIQNSGLEGVCGLVAQLGQVDPQYQLALETAAGSRLGNIVVENDEVAAAGIQLLKEKKGGRATFLPLNKIRANPRFVPIFAAGFINYAVNLVEYPLRYKPVFAYVFGNTVVFDTLENARRCIGQYRIVTLDGELLETSGAMSGGSQNRRGSAWSFTTKQTELETEQQQYRERLQEIEQVLQQCQQAMSAASDTAKQRSEELMEARSQRQQIEWQYEQNQNHLRSLQQQKQQTSDHLQQTQTELQQVQERLQTLQGEIPSQEEQLATYRSQLQALEASPTHNAWQEVSEQIEATQGKIANLEKQRQEKEEQQQERSRLVIRLSEKIESYQQRAQECQQQGTELSHQLSQLQEKAQTLQAQIRESELAIDELQNRLQTAKTERDRIETTLKELQQQKRELQWQQQKTEENRALAQQKQQEIQPKITEQRSQLPDPLPAEIPEKIKSQDVQDLEREIRNLESKMRQLEPVNMLALEEYRQTQQRLEELSEKRTTLEAERQEILLRIENFTTLRLRAFQESFDAVNENFQKIFAELSEGDGHMQLDDPDDPFNSGLNLVAHPQGKPVKRLASMSGGEKSLTALSFIFALQRYRPSPFYAFDEVDMFLDGSNVERLARMIVQQAATAQFIVVSHKGPMVKSAQRAIGVTQAKGAFTQAIGLDLASENSQKPS
jgi:chromosome segregation protein